MATQNELLAQAVEIRDAEQEGENTALRVGSLLLDIIQTIGDYASDDDLDNAITQLWEQLPTVFAKIDSTGLLRWHQSPIVFLKSMGHDLNDVDGGYYTPTYDVGDVWYSNGALHHKVSEQQTQDYSIRTNCIYVNKHTLRAYEYKSSSFVELTNENRALKNRRVIDDMEVTDLNGMSVGEVAFLPATKKIAIKTAERSWITFSPDPNKIYCDKDAGTTMIWDADEETWQQVGGSGEGSGGGSIVTITEDENYVNINIVDNTPALSVSAQNIVMGGSTKTATFKVSGVRLRGNINIGVSGNGFSLSQTSIVPTDGVVGETTITLTYSGSATASATITISSNGAIPQTISAMYTEQEIPTIDVSPNALSFKALIGGSQTKTLTITGYNLEAAIQLALTDSVGERFSLSTNSLTPDAQGMVSAQVSITYTPTNGDSADVNTTLRLTSTNAENVDVALTGALAGELSITPSTAAIGIVSGGSGKATFNVTGIRLTPNSIASVNVNGTGFSVSPSTLDADSNGEIDASIEVTFSNTADSSGTLSVSHAEVDNAATASVEGRIVTPLPANAAFVVDNIYYKVNSDQVSVRVWNGTSETGASTNYRNRTSIVIPSSVSDAGKTASLSGGGTQEGNGFTYEVTEIGDNAFRFGNDTGQGDGLVQSISLPNTLKRIGTFFMYNCRAITSVTIPYSVESIGSFFCSSQCRSLTEINMLCATNPNFSTALMTDQYSFCSGCSGLKELVIPDKVTALTNNGLYALSGLEKITFGTDMANTANVFSYGVAVNVTTIIFSSATPPKYNLSGSSYSIDSNVLNNATVYVPDDALDAYSASTSDWKSFYTNGRMKGISELPSND